MSPSNASLTNVNSAPKEQAPTSVAQKTSIFPFDDRLEIQFPRRKSIYYSVTEPEIEVYAQFGWLSTIFLTFFGASAGFALGCVTAMLQGNIPTSAQNTLTALSATMGIVSAVFLVLAIALILLQSKNRRAWRAS